MSFDRVPREERQRRALFESDVQVPYTHHETTIHEDKHSTLIREYESLEQLYHAEYDMRKAAEIELEALRELITRIFRDKVEVKSTVTPVRALNDENELEQLKEQIFPLLRILEPASSSRIPSVDEVIGKIKELQAQLQELKQAERMER